MTRRTGWRIAALIAFIVIGVIIGTALPTP
jgi:hypothetical protein